MSRKLLLLDAALVTVIIFAAVQLRAQYRAEKAREAAKLNQPVKALPTPKPTPQPSDPPVMAASYASVAQNLLFDRSRNPNVVVEIAPPPAPKPVPPLPIYHGMMQIGSGGPTAFLSINKDSPHKAIHPGEQIGQFKLIDVNSVEMTLEWEGQTIRKRVDELAAMAAPPAEPEPAPAAAPAAQAAPPPPPKAGPGDSTAFGFKDCKVNDGVAENSVVDGYKKVMHQTPFGPSCTYEPAGK